MPSAPLHCRIQDLSSSLGLPLSVLRLDEVHPVISGNKWFKLEGYLQRALDEKKSCLLTFGGPWSNHLVATAAAAKLFGLKSIGLVRGEEPVALSAALQSAIADGMQLHFLSRNDYRHKRIPAGLQTPDTLVIPEGGYGPEGVQGARSICQSADTHSYTHLVTAVGTGTTLAGLVCGAAPGQSVVGISVLRNARSLQGEIEALVPAGKLSAFVLLHDFHFGGYAKSSPALYAFMNDWYRRTAVPTDFVYTAKTFAAVINLFDTGYFKPKDSVLVVHTGGLQGNRSLPKGTLIFEV